MCIHRDLVHTIHATRTYFFPGIHMIVDILQILECRHTPEPSCGATHEPSAQMRGVQSQLNSADSQTHTHPHVILTQMQYK